MENTLEKSDKTVKPEYQAGPASSEKPKFECPQDLIPALSIIYWYGERNYVPGPVYKPLLVRVKAP